MNQESVSFVTTLYHEVMTHVHTLAIASTPTINCITTPAVQFDI